MAGARLARRSTEVLVVGAGPAGSAAAGALSRRGIEVLLVDDPHPTAGGHDVTVSAAAFDAAGLAPAPPARRLDGLELVFGAGRRRLLADPGLYAYPDRTFRDGLKAAAIAGGATVLTGRVGDGMLVRTAGGEAFVADARHVVVASAGPARSPRAGTVVSRRLRGVDLGARTTLHFSTPAATDPAGRMACARLVPGAAGTCTLTVTSLNPVPAAELFAGMHAEIVARTPGLGSAEPIGPLVSAPVNVAFSPDACVVDGRLLVGDAAGLTNPFTGEGLGYAVQSAVVAAECIADHPADPAAAAAAYRRRVGAAFVGYFETARHAAHRYHLAWRALAATLHTDGPFFTKARRALVLPEGLDRVSGRQRVAVPPADSMLVKAFLAGCDEIEIAAVRTEWPFLARLFTAGAGERLRPAVLLLAGALCGGGPPPPQAAPIAAAIELAALAMLAFIGAPTEPRPPARGVDWACATRVLAGDFLIATAARLVAGAAGSRFSYAFAEWLCELTALRSHRLEAAGPTAAADLFGTLFEFPCRIGAELGGAAPHVGKALREHGFECGRAFLFAEDLAALEGRPNRLDTTLAALLADRVSAVPDLLPDREPDLLPDRGPDLLPDREPDLLPDRGPDLLPDRGPDLLPDRDHADTAELRTRARGAVRAALTDAYDRSLGHLAEVPSRPAGMLRAFAATVATPNATRGSR